MRFRKFRWSQVYESSEEELVALLQARKIDGKRIHADVEQTEQRAESVTTLWCAEGSLVVGTESTDTPLQPGDALRLEAGTAYSVRPGIANCVYYLTS
jgi:hypothetical protein